MSATLQDKKVLVTGGSGMLGSHVADRLAAMDTGEIVVVDRVVNEGNLANALGTGRVRTVEGDIRDVAVIEPLVTECDVVIHLAGLLLLATRQDPRVAFEVNLVATYDLLTLAAHHDVERFVFGSSVGVYGQPTEDYLITEDSPIGARTEYGACKFGSEVFCRSFAESAGLSYVALRFGTLFGDRLHGGGFYPRHLLETLDQLDQGQRPRVEGDPQELHDFLYVGDAADAVVLAATSAADDVTLNIVSGSPVTLETVFGTLLEVRGSQQAIDWVPRQVQFATHRRFSRALAHQVLGWAPETSLEEALRRVVEWRSSRLADSPGSAP